MKFSTKDHNVAVKNILPSFVFLFPILVLTIFLYLRFNSASFYRDLIREDRWVENIQFYLYLLSSPIALFISIKLLFRKDRVLGVLYLVFSGLLLFAAFEEISWGQRILGAETPAFFKQYNTQNEITVHNLSPFQPFLHFLYIFVGFYACFAYFMVPQKIRSRHSKAFQLIVPRPRFFSYFLPAFIYYAAWEVIRITQGKVISKGDQELTEMFLALGFFVFLVTNWFGLRKLYPDAATEK